MHGRMDAYTACMDAYSWRGGCWQDSSGPCSAAVAVEMHQLPRPHAKSRSMSKAPTCIPLMHSAHKRRAGKHPTGDLVWRGTAEPASLAAAPRCQTPGVPESTLTTEGAPANPWREQTLELHHNSALPETRMYQNECQPHLLELKKRLPVIQGGPLLLQPLGLLGRGTICRLEREGIKLVVAVRVRPL